jgi:hypothetical protein
MVHRFTGFLDFFHRPVFLEEEEDTYIDEPFRKS